MATRGLTPPPGLEGGGIPIPQAPDIQAQPAPIPQNLTGQEFQVQHPGATSKAGGIAFIADKFLKGWMAGRYMGQERQMQQARQQISDARTTVDVAGQAYQTLKGQGKDDNDPEVQKAKTALKSAYSNYLQMAEKYVTPEPQPGQKKPGFGKRMKEGLGGGAGPHLFLQSSLNVLKNVDPTVFYGEDPNHAQQRKLQQAQLEEVKRKQDYEKALSVPEEKRTPEQKTGIEGYERTEFGPKPEKQKLEDQMYKDVASGKSTSWTPEQRDMAYNLNILHRQSYSMIPETVTDPRDYRKQRQIIHVMDEQGNQVRVIQSPFVNLLPPDHFQTAQQALDGTFAVWKKHFVAAGYSAQQAEQMSLEAVSKGKWMDVPSQDDQRMQNDALHFALDSIQKKYKADHPGASAEEISGYMNKFQTFVTMGPNGQLLYDGAALKNPKVTYEEPGTFAKLWGLLPFTQKPQGKSTVNYPGGASQQDLGPMENELRSYMRSYLDKQKGLKPEQANRIMGNQLTNPMTAGLKPPPGAGITPPPGGAGQKLYSLTINGETYQRWMTDTQAQAIGRNQNVKISPIGGDSGVQSAQGPPGDEE